MLTRFRLRSLSVDFPVRFESIFPSSHSVGLELQIVICINEFLDIHKEYSGISLLTTWVSSIKWLLIGHCCYKQTPLYLVISLLSDLLCTRVEPLITDFP